MRVCDVYITLYESDFLWCFNVFPLYLRSVLWGGGEESGIETGPDSRHIIVHRQCSIQIITIVITFRPLLYAYRKPPKQQPPQHRLNLSGASGGGGPPRRKLSGYTRPQFAGPMELETLMEEGASPGPDRRGADDPTEDDGDTCAPVANGDKTRAAQQHNQQQQQQKRPVNDAANMKTNNESSRSSINLYLAACTGRYNQSYCGVIKNRSVSYFAHTLSLILL